MSYDHELTLIREELVQDDIGNQTPVYYETVILCNLRSIGRNEFYNAAAAGLRPELTFVVHSFEYEGQRLVEYEGSRYSVIRTYGEGTEEMELTCQKVIGDG